MSGIEISLNDELKQKASEIQPELVEIRRAIHRNPEIGYEEYETSRLLREKLEALDIAFQDVDSETGVVGIIEGCRPGKTLLLRADIDALTVQEKTGLPYASKNEGKMHACGHDAHAAILFGAVKILSAMKDKLHGTVKFMFQPAEEAPNGGLSMIKAGVMENPHVDVAMATHVWPDIEAGKFGVRSGNTMASPGFYSVKINGRGGHGAMPEKCIDPIAVGNEICAGFKSIPISMAGVLDPVVVSVTKFTAGTCNNAFPDTCMLEGTVRSYGAEARARLPEEMEKIIKLSCEKYGASYEFNYRCNCPAVVNDDTLAKLASSSIMSLYGNDAVVPTPYPAMTGEDFAVFMQETPGVFFWTGVRSDEECTHYPLHHPQFAVDESILSSAAAAMAKMAIDYLIAADIEC